jgi:hypothetical protein
MTDFIESFATQQLLPPWTATDSRHWAFVLRLEKGRVAAYLDTYFNGRYPDRAPYLYIPLPGRRQYAVLGIDDYPNVASKNVRTASSNVDDEGESGALRGSNNGDDDGDKTWDRLAHLQAYLMFPALRYSLSNNNLLTDPQVVWVEPISFSNNDSVVFSSREIWGSDMYLAEMCRPDGAPSAELHFDMGLMGMKEFSARSFEELLAVMHVKTGGQVDLVSTLSEIPKTNPHILPFLQILTRSVTFAGVAPDLGPSPYGGTGRLNNLKQFRDCYNMNVAIYRAIVESEASHTNVKDVRLFDPSKVEIDFMWSDSMAELLTDLLGAKKPTHPGPPLNHAPPRTPPVPLGRRNLEPDEFPKRTSPAPIAANDMNWDMGRLAVKAEFAFTYTSDVEFVVVDTIHTYGLTET